VNAKEKKGRVTLITKSFLFYLILEKRMLNTPSSKTNKHSNNNKKETLTKQNKKTISLSHFLFFLTNYKLCGNL